MQIAKLDFPLAGTIVMDGFPIPPLSYIAHDDSLPEARKNATYYGDDMRWFIYHGGADPIFGADFTIGLFKDMFKNLQVSDTLKTLTVVPGMKHQETQVEFECMQKFIKGIDAETCKVKEAEAFL